MAPASGFVALAPTRAADTRTGDPLGAGRALDVDLSAIVPAGASAAMVNLTAVDPCGRRLPHRLRLRHHGAGGVERELRARRRPGPTWPSSSLGQDRHLCVYSYATTDVVVDVSGWLAPGQGWRYQALTPSRLVDTRDAYRAMSSVVGKRAAGATLPVTVTPWPEAPDLARRRAGERDRRRRRRHRAT